MRRKEFDRELASALWYRIQLTTSNHRLYPKQHQGNVIFVGFVDFTISIDGIPFLCLPGTDLKLIGDQIHFAPKSEQARDGSLRYFSLWFPVSPEARAVLTELLKQDARVVQMCHDAVRAVTAASPSVTQNSPFWE